MWSSQFLRSQVAQAPISPNEKIIILGDSFSSLGNSLWGSPLEVLVWENKKPRILAIIADCESGGEHFNSDGSVKRGRVNSYDIGKYQINVKIWGKKASQLGYDIFTEQGNELMARWIYENYGTSPWNLSKKCWQYENFNL